MDSYGRKHATLAGKREFWRAHRSILETPNVRAKRAATAGRQARAGENVHRTAGPGLVACRWYDRGGWVTLFSWRMGDTSAAPRKNSACRQILALDACQQLRAMEVEIRQARLSHS